MVAVAVSGGPDSLALAVLADGWARARGGRVFALVVDHGVRKAAAIEARIAASWLEARGIEARLITLAGVGARAEALRRARLDALADAAAGEGALHLLLAHHALDQAETVLLRLSRGSGRSGLAAMAPARALGPVRLLRPLLAEPPGALRAFLRGLGQPWIEDPSNTGPATRARLRAALRDGDGEGVATRAALAIGSAAARRRTEAERALAEALAEAVTVSPLGFARLDGARFASWDAALRREAIAALLRCIGGHQHPVRGEQIAPLLSRMAQGGGGTAAGCIVAKRGEAWLIAREPAAVAHPVRVVGPCPIRWDGRWRVIAAPGDTIAALGAAGAATICRSTAAGRGIPHLALATLPAISRHGVLVAVPPILYDGGVGHPVPEARFRPPVPLIEPWAEGAGQGPLEGR